jgi:hypothetical protein
MEEGGHVEGRIFEKFGLLISGRVRHTIPPWWWPEIADSRYGTKEPEEQPHIVFSE